MADRTWKLGEPCFIVDMSISMMHARMRVMPAIITHTASGFARGTSYSPGMAGKQFIEGTPFACEKEAREWIAGYVDHITAAAKDAYLEGMQPGWQIPEAPCVGDVIYGIDDEAKEVFEATVGIVRIELGRLEVGYDQSPGNPEASNVRIKEWWRWRSEAMNVARARHNCPIEFVSKEELALRTNKEINKIWSDAEKRLTDPEWIKQFGEGIKALGNRASQPATTE